MSSSYILLVYMDEKRWEALPEAEQNRIHDECTAWHEDLVQKGVGRMAQGLYPASTATTVRKAEGQRVVTDGPFTETKEVLGGFETVECADLDEAIAIAGTFPALSLGFFSMEVRRLMPEGAGCRL